MTYIIAEPCIDIKDLSCVDVCPVDCIHEFERILMIDPEECIDCGACEPECPVEAIFPEDALPAKWEPFVKINYAYDQGADVINKLTDEYATEHNVQNPPLEIKIAATGHAFPHTTEEGSHAAESLEREARTSVRAHQGQREAAGRSTKRGRGDRGADRQQGAGAQRRGEGVVAARRARTSRRAAAAVCAPARTGRAGAPRSSSTTRPSS